MHAVKSGAANQSYGLQVARLAGVPKSIIENARKKLRKLEQQSVTSQEKYIEENTGQMELFNNNPHPIIEQLQELDIDNITPRDAHELLYELCKKSHT